MRAAAIITQPDDLEISTIDDPAPAPREVVVEVRRRDDGSDDAPARPGHRAASVDVVDNNAERLATARQLGCSAVATSADEFDRPPYGWDLVIDATGNAKADVFISDRLPLAAFPDAIARFQAGIGRKSQIQPGLATA